MDCGVDRYTGDGLNTRIERCDDCARKRRRKIGMKYIVDSINEWADLFGVPPTAADWNLHMARNAGQEWKVARHESTGRPWPDVSTVQKLYGSWNAAIEAAGWEPRPPGLYGRDGELDEVCEEIAEQYRSGVSAYALARQYGLSETGAAYRIRKAGTELRSHAEAMRLQRERTAV
jgi:hypothetical protein